MTKRRVVLIIRSILLYIIFLGLAKSSFMFDRGIDLTNIFQLMIITGLIVYRLFVFVVIPVLLTSLIIFKIFGAIGRTE